MEKQFFSSSKEKDITNVISNWSEQFFSQEICGFVGIENDNYTAILCPNKSRDPKETFTIDPLEYLFFVEKYEPLFVFHSHVIGDEKFSKEDIIMSENSCLPFVVYSINTRKFNFHRPVKTKVNISALNKFEK